MHISRLNGESVDTDTSYDEFLSKIKKREEVMGLTGDEIAEVERKFCGKHGRFNYALGEFKSSFL